MSVWIIEPRDPLIVRDGRPFGLIPGARASSLPFPFPSTTTGALRTQIGLDNQGVFQKSQAQTLKKVEVRGPLLVALEGEHESVTWYAPAPADAVVLEGNAPERIRRVPLTPLERSLDTESDLTAAHATSKMALVGMTRSDPSKPVSRPPAFWSWGAFESWLIAPTVDPEEGVSPADIGIEGLVREQRTHVRISPETQTASEGALFQTQGLEFSTRARDRLGLAVATGETLHPGLIQFGGEGRLATWRRCSAQFPKWPEGLKDTIAAQKACRVVLLTPAHFEAGFVPTWLCQSRHSVTPQIDAIALTRFQVVSGWDYERRRPKPTRRLAPAGSVFFLRLNEAKEDDIMAWLDTIWMRNVSDGEQDRLDGFGLAAVGVWNGRRQQMEVRT